jgi:hypothetical protein
MTCPISVGELVEVVVITESVSGYDGARLGLPVTVLRVMGRSGRWFWWVCPGAGLAAMRWKALTIAFADRVDVQDHDRSEAGSATP